MNSNDFKSESYDNFTIIDITDDSIVVKGGYIRDTGKKEDKEYIIPLSNLLEIFTDVSTEKLHYNVEEIADDWVSILNENEKKEFKTQKINKLYNKWREAIVDRTWMCRTEHHLPKLVEDKGNHENVYANVKEVIKIVKDLL